MDSYQNDPEYQAIQNSRRYAQMLRQQAMSQDQGQTVSGHYVAPSITQGIAKLFQGYQAGKLDNDANTKQRALADALKQKRSDWMGAMPKATSQMGADGFGPPQTTQPSEQDYMAWALRGGEIDPALMQAGMGAVNNQQNREARRELADQASADRMAAQQAQAQAAAERQTEMIAAREQAAKEAAANRLAIAGMANSTRAQAAQDKKDAAATAKQQTLDQQTLSAQQVLDQAGILYAHPGREMGTGASSFMSMVPGTDAKGFKANLDTFKAQTFVPMVSALKGMGALSDAEGKKLSESVGALDPSMPEKEFNKSLKDVTSYLYKKAKASGLNVSLPDFAAEDGASGAIAAPARRSSDKVGSVMRFDAQGNPVP